MEWLKTRLTSVPLLKKFDVDSLRRVDPKVLCIILLIICGIWVRWADLAWHFSHIDDISPVAVILEHKEAGKSPLFVVPFTFNYAPFQFLFTPFLVSNQQSYRDLLFWGRFPSFLFSIIGLIALVIFYRKYSERHSWAVVLALALLVFSWEDIIFSKQMGNYALGVTASILLFILYINNLNNPSFSLGKMALNGLMIAILCTMHYQILFFIPSFFFGLALYVLSHKKNILVMVRNFLVGGAACLAALFPLWFFFLRKYTDQGISYGRGSHDEFLFLFKEGMPFFDKCIYAVGFYARNFFLVLKANTGFIPYEHPLFVFATSCLMALFVLGVVGYFDTRDVKKRFMGVFFGILMFVWVVLVCLGKIALSPTRHSLILLPFMCVTVSGGLEYLIDKMKKLRNLRFDMRLIHVIVSICIGGLFFLSFPKVLSDRRDPLSEAEIIEAFKEHGVNYFFVSTNIRFMRDVARYVKQHNIDNALNRNSSLEDLTIAWVSRRDDMQKRSMIEIMMYIMVQKIGMSNFSVKDLPQVRMLYAKRIKSNVEIEFSPDTTNKPNALYFYIFRLENRKQDGIK